MKYRIESDQGVSKSFNDFVEAYEVFNSNLVTVEGAVDPAADPDFWYYMEWCPNNDEKIRIRVFFDGEWEVEPIGEPKTV